MQHGYIVRSASGTNVIAVSHSVCKKVPTLQQVDAVYFDLRWAFDLVTHPLIIFMLGMYNVPGGACLFGF